MKTEKEIISARDALEIVFKNHYSTELQQIIYFLNWVLEISEVEQ